MYEQALGIPLPGTCMARPAAGIIHTVYFYISNEHYNEIHKEYWERTRLRWIQRAVVQGVLLDCKNTAIIEKLNIEAMMFFNRSILWACIKGGANSGWRYTMILGIWGYKIRIVKTYAPKWIRTHYTVGNVWNCFVSTPIWYLNYI